MCQRNYALAERWFITPPVLLTGGGAKRSQSRVWSTRQVQCKNDYPRSKTPVSPIFASFNAQYQQACVKSSNAAPAVRNPCPGQDRVCWKVIGKQELMMYMRPSSAVCFATPTGQRDLIVPQLRWLASLHVLANTLR